MAGDYEHVFAEQGRRWQDEDVDVFTRGRVDTYTAMVAAHREVLAAVVALARKIEFHTIEKILARSDLDLVLDALRGAGLPHQLKTHPG